MDKQEAIKILKEFHDTSALFSVRTALETVFPELKEGEDEKIRKTLIEYFNAYPKDYYGALKKRYIVAWLEKQGRTSKEWTISDAATFKELIDFLENGTAKLQHDLTRYANWLKIQFTPIEKQDKQKETICDKCKKEQPSHFCQDITALGRCALEKQGEKKPFDYENANTQQKDFAPKATAANRQLYNRAILKILSDYIEKYPDTRFGQMLCNLDVNPHFDQESRETYWNLSKTINKQNHE